MRQGLVSPPTWTLSHATKFEVALLQCRMTVQPVCQWYLSIGEPVVLNYGCKTPRASTSKRILSGAVTHVRGGDTIEVNGIPIRLAALDCPEKGKQKGDYATKVTKPFYGLHAKCELTGARTYYRLAGYCSINGTDFGRYTMHNSSCKVWEKFDVWNGH